MVPIEEVAYAELEQHVEDLQCPICGRKLFACNNDRLKLRTRILIFENGYAIAKCKYCRSNVIVPVVMCDAFDRESLPVWDEELDGKEISRRK